MASSSKMTRVKLTNGRKKPRVDCSECGDIIREDTSSYNADPAIRCDECKKWVHQWCAKLSNKDFKAFQNDESLSFHCFKCNHEAQSVRKPTRPKKRKSQESLVGEGTKKPKRQPLKRTDNESTGCKEKLLPHDILEKYREKIVHNFSKNPSDIMPEIYALGFISKEGSESFNSETDVEKRAQLLYDGCHYEIKNHSQQFKSLMSILENKSYTKCLFEDLQAETTDNDEIQPFQSLNGPLLISSSRQSATSYESQDKLITASDYWRIGNCGINGNGEIIAILDTGINSDVRSVINPYPIDEDNWVDEDPNAHGSMVAIVAGSRETRSLNSNITCSFTRGVAPGAQLAICKVAKESARPYDPDKVLKYLSLIYEHNNKESNQKIRLVVMPFRLPDIAYGIEKEIEIKLTHLQLQEVICVVAAGNDGKNASPNFPAKSEKVLTVGSVDAFGKFSSFSSDHECIDVLAPGTNILFREYFYGEDRRLITDSGTSYAAPAVAGLIARLFECARMHGDEETLSRLSDLPRLKKFLKKHLCESKLLQPAKVSKFFMNPPENIATLTKDLD